MKKLKKQMVGVVVLSLICSIVLACILGIAVTIVMGHIAYYATNDSFGLMAWASKLSETSVYILACSFVCIFTLSTVTVLLYRVNSNLWDKIHECNNLDEGFIIMKLIPDVKRIVVLLEKLGSKFSKA